MKKLVYTVSVAFWSSLATLLAVDALAPPAAAQPAAVPRAIDAAELARHATPADCWMAIDGIAYDVTGYLPGHPSAPDVMTRWCGREASEAFATKGYGRPHSAGAQPAGGDGDRPLRRVAVSGAPCACGRVRARRPFRLDAGATRRAARLRSAGDLPNGSS